MRLPSVVILKPAIDPPFSCSELRFPTKTKAAPATGTLVANGVGVGIGVGVTIGVGVGNGVGVGVATGVGVGKGVGVGVTEGVGVAVGVGACDLVVVPTLLHRIAAKHSETTMQQRRLSRITLTEKPPCTRDYLRNPLPHSGDVQ